MRDYCPGCVLQTVGRAVVGLAGTKCKKQGQNPGFALSKAAAAVQNFLKVCDFWRKNQKKTSILKQKRRLLLKLAQFGKESDRLAHTPKILVINGPNLNFLGVREPAVYGSDNLNTLIERLQKQAQDLGVELEHFQSNSEGALVDRIQQAYGNTDFILINAGAYTHTSVAILDALSSVSIPFIEIHISNVHAREEFRHHSYLSAKAVGVIVGFGLDGYGYALDKAARLLKVKD